MTRQISPVTTADSPTMRAVRLDAAIRVVLIVAAVAPFVGTFFYGFIYDDKGIILHNSVINGWKSLIEVWRHPYWFDGTPDSAGLYRPLLMAMFAVIWNGFHRFAIAFHLFAVALHAAVTVLTWHLLRRATNRWAAAGAALWFALQPVHVEAVANIANSSETLVALWTVLLVLLMLPRRGSGDQPLPAAPPWWGAALAGLLYAAALLTKESGAVAPALALIAAWGWRRCVPDPATPIVTRRRLRAWGPTFALWAGVAVAVAAARRAVLGGFAGTGSIAAPGLAGLTAIRRIWAMLSLGGRVGQLLFWPSLQNPNYGPTVFPRVVGPTAAAVAAAIAAALVGGWWLARYASRRDARPLVAISWCLIAFLPASNLFIATGQVLAERTLYVSSIGAAMLVAWGLDRLSELVRWQARPAQRMARGFAVVGAAVVLAAFAGACVRSFARTREYAGVWRTQRALFTQIVRADPLNYRGYQLLALEASWRGDSTAADSLYAHAYSLYPNERILLADYGDYLLERARPVEALAISRRLLGYADMRTEPRAVTLFLNATGRVWGVDSTLAVARRLMARAPSARSALFVGMALQAKGDVAGAKAAYADGLQLAPRDSALSARVASLSPNG